MLSPSPTRNPPAPAPEEKKTTSTPIKPRIGETPTARAVKGVLRPIFKGLYYVLRVVGNYKLVTLVVIAILLASAFVTSYTLTKSAPLGIGSDPFNKFNVKGQGAGELVKSWLFALRDGDVTAMTLIERNMLTNTAPDPQGLVDLYSQPKAHLVWSSIEVVGVRANEDNTIDGFIFIELTAPTPGVTIKGFLIFHIVSIAGRNDVLYSISLVDFRPPIPG